MYERPRVNVKVERGSTFTFTRGLSCIAFILFTRVKFPCVTVEIHLQSRKKKRPILTTKTQVGHLTFFGTLFLNPLHLWKFLDCLKSPLFGLVLFFFFISVCFLFVFFLQREYPSQEVSDRFAPHNKWRRSTTSSANCEEFRNYHECKSSPPKSKTKLFL